ncbi:MAG: acyltransferase family protein [Cellvibrionaceae bacterium]
MFKVISLQSVLRSALGSDSGSKQHIDYLDGWRGLAILFVLVAHFFVDGYLPLLFMGEFGVNVFFVLSGMLMSHILFVKETPLSIFYKRRFSRILPAFLLFVVVTYVVAWIQEAPEAKNFIYSLFFLRTYFPDDVHIWKSGIAIGHLWSLNVEEHAYLLLSLLTFLPFFKGRQYYVLIPLGVLSILIHLYYKLTPDTAPIAAGLRTEAALGFIFISGGLYLMKDKLEHLVYPWMVPMAFALAFGVSFFRGSWLITPFLLAFTVNYLHKSPSWLLGFLCLPVLRLFGVLSFSIYLWQQPFYKFGVKLNYSNTLTEQILYLVLAILAGVISFYLIEKPARSWLNRNW